MKNAYRTLMGLGLAALAPLAAAQDTPAPAPAPAPAAAAAATPLTPEQVKEVFSYFLGHDFGVQMAMGAPALEVGDIDQAAFFRAVADGMENKVDPAMDEQKLAAAMDSFLQTLQDRAAAKGAANLAAGQKFLEENAKKEGVKTTDSGLQYKVIKESRGMRYNEKKDGPNAECAVIYEGRLIDGTVFDATTTPVPMPINRVVPGFSEALKLMPVGSTYEVYIPADLGYGEQGPGIIGPNSVLIFTITLTDITPGKAMGSPAAPIQLTPEMIEQLQAQGLQPVAPAPAPAAK